MHLIYRGDDLKMAENPNDKLSRLQAQINALQAKAMKLKAKEAEAARKADTRRKIIVGGAVLAHAEHDPAFAAALQAALSHAVTRDKDREAIADLLK